MKIRYGIMLVALLLGAKVRAETAPEYASVSRGLIVDGGFGTNIAGDAILGGLGLGSLGAKTYGDRGWLLQWDAQLAGIGGMFGNQHPFLAVFGGRLNGDAEIGRRFLPATSWSPYAGVGLIANLSLLASPSTPLDKLNTVNTMAGLGGFNATVSPRVGAGVSWIDGSYSLLLEAFFQEGLRVPAVNLPGAAFSEGGLRARFDVTHSWMIALAAFAGPTPTTTFSALNYTESTVHKEVNLHAQKTFGNGMWMGAMFALSNDTHHQVYAGGRTYDSASAPTFNIGLEYGFPLWRQE